MYKFYLALFVGLLGCAPLRADDGLKPSRYGTCNVFTSAGCFGIAQGDKLSAEILLDFVLYKVDIAGGGKAELYVGFNPKKLDGAGKCSLREFSHCEKVRETDGSVHMQLQRSGRDPFMDVVLDARISPDIVNSFLSNIRPCERSGQSINCSP